jgi:aryl-alcohol dehydrogenase-like predicted oxidoreductase
MQQRTMGGADLAVSASGFGRWELGGTDGAFDERETAALPDAGEVGQEVLTVGLRGEP